MKGKIHENERYYIAIVPPSAEDVVEVFGASYVEFYAVVNKETGVIECKCPALPDAVMFAENSNALLEQKPWAWRAKEAANAADIVAATEESPAGKH